MNKYYIEICAWNELHVCPTWKLLEQSLSQILKNMDLLWKITDNSLQGMTIRSIGGGQPEVIPYTSVVCFYWYFKNVFHQFLLTVNLAQTTLVPSSWYLNVNWYCANWRTRTQPGGGRRRVVLQTAMNTLHTLHTLFYFATFDPTHVAKRPQRPSTSTLPRAQPTNSCEEREMTTVTIECWQWIVRRSDPSIIHHYSSSSMCQIVICTSI